MLIKGKLKFTATLFDAATAGLDVDVDVDDDDDVVVAAAAVVVIVVVIAEQRLLVFIPGKTVGRNWCCCC